MPPLHRPTHAQRRKHSLVTRLVYSQKCGVDTLHKAIVRVKRGMPDCSIVI
jgi:hypothetical protein